MIPTSPRKIMLSYSQKLSLDRWLIKNLDKITTSRMQVKDISVLASKELGFMMTMSNVRNLAKEINLKLPRFVNKVSTPKSKIDILCRRHLARLYQKLGEAVPLDLIEYLVGEELLETTATSVSREVPK